MPGKVNAPENIDHFIQLDILKKLVVSTEPLKFSDLINPELENGLFAYHLKKLTDRGLIEKGATGQYLLTSKGAQVGNWYSESLATILQPRNLVNFYIEQNNQILLVKRTDAYSSLLNTYLFPGGIVKYGTSTSITAAELTSKRFGNSLQHEFLFTFEPIIHSPSGFTTHHIVSFYRLQEVPVECIDSERFMHQWFPIDKVTRTGDFLQAPFIKDVIELVNDKKAVGHIALEYGFGKNVLTESE